MNNSNITKYFSYAGLLPVLIAIFMIFLGIDPVAKVIHIDQFIILYGVLIAVFIAGSHWGLSLDETDTSFLLILSSNLQVVVLWLSYVLLPKSICILIVNASLICSLLIERSLTRDGILNRSYFAMRLRVSAMLILALFIVWVYLI